MTASVDLTLIGSIFQGSRWSKDIPSSVVSMDIEDKI